MAKMTKTQQRRLYESILKKSYKVATQFNRSTHSHRMSITDLTAIERICNKYLKKF